MSSCAPGFTFCSSSFEVVNQALTDVIGSDNHPEMLVMDFLLLKRKIPRARKPAFASVSHLPSIAASRRCKSCGTAHLGITENHRPSINFHVVNV